MSDETRTAKTILSKALEIDSSQERSAYLDQACGDDLNLRGEVEELLRAIDQAGSFLANPPVNPMHEAVTEPPPSVNEGPGTLIGGRYKLLQQIGEGGMGIVYMAEQTGAAKSRAKNNQTRDGY